MAQLFPSIQIRLLSTTIKAGHQNDQLAWFEATGRGWEGSEYLHFGERYFSFQKYVNNLWRHFRQHEEAN